jgi:long-chain fatty acid transport protein
MTTRDPGRMQRLLPPLLLIAAVTPAAATNGYFMEGYGIKNEGVAGAGIAFPQDTLTIATNPAGLTVPDPSFDAGVDIFLPRRGATIDQGGAATGFNGDDSSWFPIPSLGYSYRVDPKLVVGVAMFGNGGLNTNYSVNPFGRFGAQGSAGVNLEQAFLSPAVAYNITPTQSVGLAANLAWQRFSAKGIGLFSGFSSDPTAVSNRGNDDSTGGGVRLGWLGRFGPYVTLGATWQSKTYMGKFDKYAGLFAGQGSFDIPATYGLGVAVTPVAGWTVALDWQKIQYSGIPAVVDPINSLFAGVPLGASHGPGFGWRGVSVVKLGSSYDLNEQATLRIGFSANNQQPVPSSQTFFNVLAPGVIRYHLTLGGTWNLDAKNEIDFDYQRALRGTVNGMGSIPPAFGGGEVNLNLEENSFGVGYAHKL